MRDSWATKLLVRQLGASRSKGERRSGSHKRLLYCVSVNRTSLDHLPLGVVADIDEMSHGKKNILAGECSSIGWERLQLVL